MSILRGCGLAGVVAVVLAPLARADDLIIIDLSVPNQITMNATNGFSAATMSGSDIRGVYFADFFSGSGTALTETLVLGDITNTANPADSSPQLYRGGGGSDTGLNMFSWSSDTTVDFTAGVQAFAGSATWSLSSINYTEMLDGSMSGDLYFPADTADDVASAAFIGRYQVLIPTPASAALFGLGFIVAMCRRR